MTGIQVIIRRYFREFRKDKGKKILFILLPLCVGVLVPFLYKSPSLQLLTIIGVSVFYLTQTISGVFAQEKEKKTIETLLSAPVSIKDLILGATLYNLSTALILVSFTVILQTITNLYLDNSIYWNIPRLILLITGWLITLIFITVCGLFVSMLSDNIQTASQKISTRSYTALFFLSICITFLEMGNDNLYTFFILLYILVLSIIVLHKLYCSINKLSIEHVIIGIHNKHKKQSFSPIKRRYRERNFGVLSQVGCILGHEWKIAKTYPSFWRQFPLMMLLPGIAFIAFYSKNGEVDFKLPMMVAVLLMARIPMNLISISIGGEKTSKTFESLLSTPISTPIMFVGKILPSVLVSGIFLLGSAAGILFAANLVNIYVIKNHAFVSFSLSEWILLLGDGLLITIIMIFITGYLALMSKTPRAGLWISLLASLVLAVPHGLILFCVKNPIPASLCYFVLLLILNTICFTLALGKIDRRVLLSRI